MADNSISVIDDSDDDFDSPADGFDLKENFNLHRLFSFPLWENIFRLHMSRLSTDEDPVVSKGVGDDDKNMDPQKSENEIYGDIKLRELDEKEAIDSPSVSVTAFLWKNIFQKYYSQLHMSRFSTDEDPVVSKGVGDDDKNKDPQKSENEIYGDIKLRGLDESEASDSPSVSVTAFPSNSDHSIPSDTSSGDPTGFYEDSVLEPQSRSESRTMSPKHMSKITSSSSTTSEHTSDTSENTSPSSTTFENTSDTSENISASSFSSTTEKSSTTSFSSTSEKTSAWSTSVSTKPPKVYEVTKVFWIQRGERQQRLLLWNQNPNP